MQIDVEREDDGRWIAEVSTLPGGDLVGCDFRVIWGAIKGGESSGGMSAIGGWWEGELSA
jgi:hypothetical protein